MTQYAIYFQQQWTGDHPAEWYRSRGPLAMAVVREMQEAGVHVFAGGLDEAIEDAFHVDPDAGGTITATDGPYTETTEFLGGIAVVDVADEAEARRWAVKLAVACGWPQEVRRLQTEPS